MNNILTVAIIAVLATSVLLIGANTPVFAQENMTMNTSSSTPVDNTTQLSDTGMGMDANTMMGNSTSDNSTTTQ
ncbi:hypothetical protein NMY3_00977 [Candidatus Nitrosocosmicus oleophilus]|jgi:hypothetical protein|uniref:Uncharacterized protein n=1 Tax=Candidatus Nitrosocosmicus oleophilus TaxID=1353260 RepID=A0A654M6T1_9ARCH|nr:hypothetical protein [Candidatus Nitrosocosmicus oleophilus]ALI35182.1 hypothetical protein NMY3_00977 [Candidatus Nitrosocosmicus oleophilus]